MEKNGNYLQLELKEQDRGSMVTTALRTPREVFEQQNVQTPYPIVAANYCNQVVSLNHELTKNGPLVPVHLGTTDGALIARRTLIFLLYVAVRELFPALHLRVSHSLDYGYFVQLFMRTPNNPEGDEVQISPKDLKTIETRMRLLIAEDLPIERQYMSLAAAQEYFREAGNPDKAELMEYTDKEMISLYSLRGFSNHFYGLLSPTTAGVTAFEIKGLAQGLNLRFARTAKPTEIPPNHAGRKIFNVLEEHDEWMRILNFHSVARLNRLIKNKKVREYILIAEALQEKRLARIADEIIQHPRKPKIVLLAGPSASGKTTSTKKLSIQLRVVGKNPVVIEMDNFFVDRDKTPKDEFGEYDFESFETIDRPKLQDCVERLLMGEEVQIPRFNFKEGRSEPGEFLKLPDDAILILEGIHGLNTELLPTIPDGMTYKIYVSPMTHLSIDDHNRISSSDARLLRRLVRDIEARGHSPLETISRWPSVRRGEERNIFPYQENADAIFNSALPYEIAALKPYALEALKNITEDHPEMAEAARLISFLSYFLTLDSDCIPQHSLLREFIGGSCFNY